ncbi:MAG: S41 family peptidase [Bacillota bacterium]
MINNEQNNTELDENSVKNAEEVLSSEPNTNEIKAESSQDVTVSESENKVTENNEVVPENDEVVTESTEVVAEKTEVVAETIQAKPIESKKSKVKRKRVNKILAKTGKSFGKISAVLLVVLVIMCAFFGGYTTSMLLQSEDAAVAEWLVEVLNDQAYYADYEGLDAAFLMEYGLSFCLREDPYCDLMTPEETTEYFTTASGSSTTFGVTVGTYDGLSGVYVASVIMGSSAQVEGLSAGMKIYAIDGIDLLDKTLDDVSSVLLAKNEGDSAYIECIYPTYEDGYLSYDETGELFTATITKEEYTPIVVEYYDNQTVGLEDLADDTAYIKVTSFIGKTAEQFDEAMAIFKESGKTNLILDLRENTGGSEENMQGVASYLLPSSDDGKNPLIITIEDKYGNVQEVRASGSYYEDMNFTDIIVLVDSYTASASEAILTAMMDYDTVSIVIGETTYGKGTGLTTVFMPVYGYSVTFTSSYYFSPNGNSHDQVGLSPTNGYYIVDTSSSFLYSYDDDTILKRAMYSLR